MLAVEIEFELLVVCPKFPSQRRVVMVIHVWAVTGWDESELSGCAGQQTLFIDLFVNNLQTSDLFLVPLVLCSVHELSQTEMVEFWVIAANAQNQGQERSVDGHILDCFHGEHLAADKINSRHFVCLHALGHDLERLCRQLYLDG